MRIKLFVIILATVLCNGIKAQNTISLYEFKYHFDNDTRQYNAFLFRNQDGTGFIRIRFNNKSGDPVLIELQLDEHYASSMYGTADTSILCFEGTDPKVLYGKDDSYGNIGSLRFQRDKTTSVFKPLGVLSRDPGQFAYKNAVLISVKHITKGDLTEALILTYFRPTDDLYVNLFKTNQKPPPAQQPTTLHLLLIANTLELHVKASCLVDKESVTRTFKNVADFMEISFDPVVIDGDNFSRASVDKAIDNLNPGKNDIVVFYYSGHGFCDKADGYLFPHLDLRHATYQELTNNSTLVMEDIYERIKSKGSRFSLVISDCCNSIPGLPPGASKVTPMVTRDAGIGWSIKNCEALFMNPARSSLLFTAASKTQESAGNAQEGGFFTFNFLSSLEFYLGKAVPETSATWEQVFNIAQKNTIAKAEFTMCPMEDDPTKFRICEQTPIRKSN